MEWNIDIQVLIWNYFQGLFQAGPLRGCHQVLSLMPTLVTPKLIETLFASLSDDEVKAAIFQLGTTKASGLNKFFGLFHQHNWDMVVHLCVELFAVFPIMGTY